MGHSFFYPKYSGFYSQQKVSCLKVIDLQKLPFQTSIFFIYNNYKHLVCLLVNILPHKSKLNSDLL